jgi:hypothetical protein
MLAATEGTQVEYFPDPLPNTSSKPILRGIYCGTNGIHTILDTVQRNNPDGEYPLNPTSDSQYYLWDNAIQNYLMSHPLACGNQIQTQEESTTPSGTLPTPIEIATTTVQ